MLPTLHYSTSESFVNSFDVFLDDLKRIAGVVGRDQSKPVNKFIYEMLYGLVASKSTRLSEIARSLNEDTILLYTEKRLHRNLYGKKFDIEILKNNYLQFIKRQINKDFIIAIDTFDLRKEYARKMEYLSRVRDGSKGEICNGYDILHIEAIHKSVKTRKNFPLALKLYSNEYFLNSSQNTIILDEVKRISKYFPNHIWVFDRGFDRRNIIDKLDDMPVTYVIRQIGLRNVIFQDDIYITRDFVKGMNLVYDVSLAYVSKRTRRVKHLSAKFGMEKIKIENTKGYKTLIVVQQLKSKPMVLITNKIPRTHLDIARLIKAYIQRWGVEESIRFLKSQEQGFDIEDIRLLKYEGLQRMMNFVLFAYGFLCFLQYRKKEELESIIEEHTRNFYKLPRFSFYRAIHSTEHVLRMKWQPQHYPIFQNNVQK